MTVEKTKNIQVVTGSQDLEQVRGPERGHYSEGSPEVAESQGDVSAAHVISRTVGARPTFPLTDTEMAGIDGDLAFLKGAIDMGKRNGMQGDQLKMFATRCADDMMRAFVEQLSKSP